MPYETKEKRKTHVSSPPYHHHHHYYRPTLDYFVYFDCYNFNNKTPLNPPKENKRHLKQQNPCNQNNIPNIIPLPTPLVHIPRPHQALLQVIDKTLFRLRETHAIFPKIINRVIFSQKGISDDPDGSKWRRNIETLERGDTCSLGVHDVICGGETEIVA
jgi:hypothetical protein